MKILDCLKIKEKAYIEDLDNGLKVIIVPKKESTKKFVIWGTKFGSIDNKFILPETGEEVSIPDGVAHFLEHKMFEQPNGSNSLDTMMALGLDANAYTTNDHTAYLFECSEDENFYKGLDELMDYVQSPYYTDENVQKEKGIIGQEIMMYNDDPGFQLYLNALKCLYSKCPIRIDIAGSIDSIAPIDPDVLYKCYNTFYNPSNMVLVVCGNFEPQNILEEISRKASPRQATGNKFLLSGMLKCARCGSSMCSWSRTSRGIYYRSYRCELKNRAATRCDSKMVNADDLESFVIELCKNINLEEIINIKKTKNNNSTLKRELTSLNKTLVENDKLLQGLVKKLALIDDIDILTIIQAEIKKIKSLHLECCF